ncbi:MULTISPECIES: TRAP transporter small permease [Thalassobaculum]|uniref:TRAP transporter small permease protein n=1 Tax=Thalassobaculum litoreum DSM 18839 TaxID=1123362 RepID=A0A8G2BIK7_9PROT|nr:MULTISPECIES: TRAP transporter small permease [Thalassobaculum]SDF89177.1 TRAP-type C4-dicarboxylate transport system, small permease component [Thalassobaculum litoreum DSM 18839]
MLIRRVLDGLYLASAALAAMLLAGIGVLILAQIVGRFFGIVVPSANEISGFFLATSTFLALAYSFRGGTHIRVTLVVSHLPKHLHNASVVLALSVATILSGYFTYYAYGLAAESWRYGDLSDGLVGVPLWIPQSSMAFGLVMMTIACFDELVRVLRGREPSFKENTESVLD